MYMDVTQNSADHFAHRNLIALSKAPRHSSLLYLHTTQWRERGQWQLIHLFEVAYTIDLAFGEQLPW